MFISCPHCRDLVAIEPGARPQSICPRCGGELPAAVDASARGPSPSPPPSLVSYLHADSTPPLADPVQAPGPTSGPSLPEPPAPEPGPGLAHPLAVPGPATTSAAIALPVAALAPGFIGKRGPAPGPALRRGQAVLLAALGLLLLLQVLIADRARLATDPRWRPVLSTVCGVLGCSLPAWRQPEAFTMLSRDVRPLPGAPGHLQVQASFRNDAAWPQAWPQLSLAFSDADGRLLAARAFTPAEYLPGGAPGTLLAPGQSAAIDLELHEPGLEAVAFTFDFR